jgi:hypothetical protein
MEAGPHSFVTVDRTAVSSFLQWYSTNTIRVVEYEIKCSVLYFGHRTACWSGLRGFWVGFVHSQSFFLNGKLTVLKPFAAQHARR